jgi:5-methylcytosine-specific restriction endonuclease McrA
MITNVDVADDSDSECAVCGEPIDTQQWHIARTSETTKGQMELLVFCCEDCHEQWHT